MSTSLFPFQWLNFPIGLAKKCFPVEGIDNKLICSLISDKVVIGVVSPICNKKVINLRILFAVCFNFNKVQISMSLMDYHTKIYSKTSISS